jgi:phosphate-selective porin OprO/OprP
MRNLLIALALQALASPLSAQTVDPQNFVIENVHVAAQGAKDDSVNLLIRRDKLELISADTIPIPDGFAALDAQGGFLVGNLTLGASPSFMILDADPRVDFGVLLDPDAHAVFVFHEGDIQKNTLGFAADMLKPKVKRKGWHAYMPPPVALPTNYGETGKWNHWATKHTTGVFFGILALDRQFWFSQNDDSKLQVGSLDAYDGGAIRDVRAGLYGTIGASDRHWGYNIAVATNAFDKRFEIEGQDNFRFVDYRLDIPVLSGSILSIGKQKEPISMERIMTLVNLPFQERSSVVDAFLPQRNFGAQLSGTALHSRISWAGGVFNNFIDSGQSIGESTTALTGRVTWLPFLTEDHSNLLHLGIAARVSDSDQGYRYRTTPEFDNSPVFVDTDLIGGDKTRQYDLEASWRHGPFWLATEYVGTEVDSPAGGGLNFSGYRVSASWIITGEMREYRFKSGTMGPVPVSRSVREHGIGAWEVAARWSSLDLTDGTVDGGEMDILSLAVNWWLTPTAMVNWNYRYIVNDKDGLEGRTSGAVLRLLLKLN